MNARDSKREVSTASKTLRPSTPLPPSKPSEPAFLARRYVIAVLLLVILAGATWFRFKDLSITSYRGDEIVFVGICSQPITAAAIFERWMELMGITGQFPFPMAFTKWFIDTVHLPPTAFGLRFPAALWGVLTVFFAYFAGRELDGRATGLVFSALLAVNAFHIQVSREAYYYPPLLVGVMLLTWGLFWTLNHVLRGDPITPKFYAIHGIGFFLTTWSQPTGWPYALVVAATTLVLLARHVWRGKHSRIPLVGLIVAYVIVGIPLLFASWALKHLILNASGATKEAAAKAIPVAITTAATLPLKAFVGFTCGATPLRVAVSLVLFIGGLTYILSQRRRDPRYLYVPGLILVTYFFFLLSRSGSAAMFELRYIAVILPVFLLVLAVGATRSAEVVARFRPASAGVGRYLPAVLVAAFLALSVPPAVFCTQLTGNPVPYSRIVEWTDSHLPKGTPVIVDRWFEPWNELKYAPSTNVIFTFTIPNEPIDTFIRDRWRETAQSFFMKYPDAAYMELAKQYWQVPGVGPWDWPRQFFGQHAAITNEAGLQLRRLGLASRSDYYADNTNRVIVDIFYNNQDDIIRKLREAGVALYPLYGDGWSFTKTQDYRDWRVLQDYATLKLLNLTQAPVTVELNIRAVAMKSSKQVQLTPDIKHTFASGQLGQWTTEPMELRPGINILRLADPLWDLAQAPLLVEQIQMRQVSQPPPAAAATNQPPGGG